MGYIIEPKSIDLVVGPSVLTEKNKKIISNAIAQYRKTGKQLFSVPVTQISTENRKNRHVNSSGKPANAAI